jgi:polyhydroxyalkanoate synthesis regulator phasin
VRWRYVNDYGNEKMMQDTYDFDKHIRMKILEQEAEIIRSRFKETDTGRLKTAVSVLEKRIEELKNGL